MKLNGVSLALLALVPCGVYACSVTTTPAPSDEVDASGPGPDPTTVPGEDAAVPDAAVTPTDGAPIPDAAPSLDPLAGVTPAEHLSPTEGTAMGLGYVDGLVWAAGALYLTDPYAEVGKGHIWKLPRVGLEPAFVRLTSSTVGLCFDPENGGALVVTETSPPAVARRPLATPDGRVALSSQFNTLGFNAPNDCEVVAGKGIYFSDPTYPGTVQPKERVYLVAGTPAVTTSVAEFDTGKHPNGLAVTKAGTTLYVSLTGENRIVKIALKADGSADGNPTDFVTTGKDPDGLATDSVGNVFVATALGVEAYSATGTKYGPLALPGGYQPTSLAFGGADGKTLYVGATKDRMTGTGAVYKLALRDAGNP